MATLESKVTVIPRDEAVQATADNPAVHGRSVADVLATADGGVQKIHLNDRNIAMLRALAALPGNEQLHEIADRGYFEVDVSGLRSHDPQERVRIRVSLAPTSDAEMQIMEP